MASRRSARVICRDGCFWTNPKQFWRWVRQGMVVVLQERPLIGRYQGRRWDFMVTVGHVILDLTCPEHLDEVVRGRWKAKRS